MGNEGLSKLYFLDEATRKFSIKTIKYKLENERVDELVYLLMYSFF